MGANEKVSAVFHRGSEEIIRYISAETGQFVTKEFAKANPSTTYRRRFENAEEYQAEIRNLREQLRALETEAE